MKLYTEEQVKQMIEKSQDTGLTAEFLIIVTPPIELPSDEYIDGVFQPMTELNAFYKDGFINGAKWMKEQIQYSETI